MIDAPHRPELPPSNRATTLQWNSPLIIDEVFPVDSQHDILPSIQDSRVSIDSSRCQRRHSLHDIDVSNDAVNSQSAAQSLDDLFTQVLQSAPRPPSIAESHVSVSSGAPASVRGATSGPPPSHACIVTNGSLRSKASVAPSSVASGPAGSVQSLQQSTQSLPSAYNVSVASLGNQSYASAPELATSASSPGIHQQARIKALSQQLLAQLNGH